MESAKKCGKLNSQSSKKEDKYGIDFIAAGWLAGPYADRKISTS
jgi:hypothetical protein